MTALSCTTRNTVKSMRIYEEKKELCVQHASRALDALLGSDDCRRVFVVNMTSRVLG